MKTNYSIFLFLVIIIFSCDSEEVVPSLANAPVDSNVDSLSICGEVQSFELIAGQQILAGFISVSNDSENLFVTYTTDNGWHLVETHLYVGSLDEVPTTPIGSVHVLVASSDPIRPSSLVSTARERAL